MERLIYVVDDENNIQELIRHYLEREGYQVEVFSDGIALLAALQERTPSLIILDVMMPGIDGFDVCRQIRQKSNVPIIFVSAKDQPEDRVTGISLGSDDYLVKPFLPQELMARVEALFRRIDMTQGIITGNNPDMLSFGDLLLNPNLQTARIHDKDVAITRTEFQFLSYLIKSPGHTASKANLLKNVWDMDPNDVETRVTDDLVKRIRKKLKDENSNIMIKTIWGYGYRLIEGENAI